MWKLKVILRLETLPIIFPQKQEIWGLRIFSEDSYFGDTIRKFLLPDLQKRGKIEVKNDENKC